MSAHGVYRITFHGFIYLIYSTRYRFYQSSASDDCIKVKRYLIGFQLLEYQILPKFKLVYHL